MAVLSISVCLVYSVYNSHGVAEIRHVGFSIIVID